jgi:hypothetical protein
MSRSSWLTMVVSLIFLGWIGSFVAQNRLMDQEFVAQREALRLWAETAQREWQRKMAAAQADQEAYLDTARRCGLRLGGQPAETPYDQAFLGVSAAEKFLCFPPRILRSLISY